MKKALLGFCLLLGLGVFVYGQRINVSQWPQQKERSRNYDALHYRIKIELDLPGESFTGETTVLLSPLENGFKRCVLDAESFLVDRVQDNWGSPLDFEQSKGQLIIHLGKEHRYGETVAFTVFYSGKKPRDGLRFYAESGDNPMLVASDSHPYGVRHWVPCNDYPNDKATNEVIAKVRLPLKVASNGRLESVTEDPASGTSTWHWVQDLPHSTYLIVLAAAPYEVVRDYYGILPINYWVYPQHKDLAQLVFGKTPQMMEFFNQLYGYEYPWAKYDQIVVPFGGGAESTSATVMGHRIMFDERGEQDFSSIGIVAHELAHQWWGDLITLRSWEHTWMNESFGTYSDYLYFRHEMGEDEGAVNLLNKKNSYLREANTRYIRPIVYERYRRPEDLFDSHSYPKGAAVLHMLRFILGDDNFFQTLKVFLHTFAFQPVDTHDFMKTVKTVTGRNLDWFFQQWLYRPGHPSFDIHSAWNGDAKKVTLTVSQTQDTSLGIPIYRTPVNISVTTAEGKKTIQVWIEKNQQTIEIPCDSKPLLVRFDEGNFLLKEWNFPKSPEELVYQLQNDDVIGRMWAAAELDRYLGEPNVQDKLYQSARQDPFWAVRRAAVHTLGNTQGTQVIEFLKEKSRDENSAVRIEALNRLGDTRHSELAEFLKQRFQEDTSYLAQAAAVTALAKCAGKKAVLFLQKAARIPSPRHVIRRAAERALEELK